MANMAEDLVRRAKDAYFEDEFQVAVDLLTQAIDLNPKNPNLYVYRAQASLHLSFFSDASLDFDNAIKRDPLMAKAYLRKGAMWLKLEKYQAAKTAFQAGAAVAPTDSRFTNFIQQCDKLLAEASNSPGSYTDFDLSPSDSEPKPYFSHEWDQNKDEIIVTIFAEEIPAESVSVDFGERNFSVTIDIPGEEPYRLQCELFGKVIPANCSCKVIPAKIEIHLVKAVSRLWSGLEAFKGRLANAIIY